MSWRNFLLLLGVVAALVFVAWKYLPQWPAWFAALWALVVAGLAGYGFYHAVRDFFSVNPSSNDEKH
jgi:uncharacterized membrane protein